MKLKFLMIIFCSLIFKINACAISELDKDRAALIATLQVFPQKYLPAHRFLRASDEEICVKIQTIKETAHRKDFFELYRGHVGVDTPILIESVRGLPLCTRYIPEVATKFCKISEDYEILIQASPLFKRFDIGRRYSI